MTRHTAPEKSLMKCLKPHRAAPDTGAEIEIFKGDLNTAIGKDKKSRCKTMTEHDIDPFVLGNILFDGLQDGGDFSSAFLLSEERTP